jgi:16S rRNA C967 or C1407 C5-methylase (RsmB/RsmF family)/NOL1/NOP2/fmu family ribosome biogenesis protein
LILPQAFTDQLKTQIGTEFADFEAALLQTPPVSIRYNPRKKHASAGEIIPWCEEGRYLEQRPVFTLDPLFHSGAFYVQEASSMLVGYVLPQVATISKPLRVLDLCAAPGGKTTLLTSILHPDSLILANEVIKGRVMILKENVQKWGFPNVHVSNHDPEDFERLEAFFDVILIDVPCSGEGLFRKDPAAINEWSPGSVQVCAGRQKRILDAAMPLLRPSGILIYCTCTYNDIENQESGQWILDSEQFTEIKIDIPDSWGVVTKPIGYQCYPHRVKGEGFFFSVFQKQAGFETAHPYDTLPRRSKEEGFRSCKRLHAKQTPEASRWLEKPENFHFFVKPNGEVLALMDSQLEEVRILDNTLSAKGIGLEMGEFKGNDFIPSHALALSTALSPNILRLELSGNEALLFLKKENLNIEAPRGWLLVTHQGLGLGWVKGLGNRINNYLPKDWRIRMEIPE